MRTALAQFSFSLVVLRIFTNEFWRIGMLFTVYGFGILLVSLFRRQQGNRAFFAQVDEHGGHQKRFRTSGNVVLVLTVLSVGAYISLMTLIMELAS